MQIGGVGVVHAVVGGFGPLAAKPSLFVNGRSDMELTSILLGMSNIFIAFIIIGISIPLFLYKIPMNHIYGVRFRKSFESESNWYKINKYGGKKLIAWSIPLILIGAITFFLPLNGNVVLTTLIAGAPLIVVVPAYMSYKFSKTL